MTKLNLSGRATLGYRSAVNPTFIAQSATKRENVYSGFPEFANIESRRSIVTDKQIEFFTEVFRVEVWELFPQRHPFKRSN